MDIIITVAQIHTTPIRQKQMVDAKVHKRSSTSWPIAAPHDFRRWVTVIHTFFFGVHGGAVMAVACAVARFLFSNCGRDSDSLKKQHKNLSTWWQGGLTQSSACHHNCIADTTTKHVNMHFRQNLFSKEKWIHLNKRTHVTFLCVTSCHFLLRVKRFEQQPGPQQSVHQSSTHNTKLCELRNEPIQVSFSQHSGSGRKTLLGFVPSVGRKKVAVRRRASAQDL
jgi:hypothetical protein